MALKVFKLPDIHPLALLLLTFLILITGFTIRSFILYRKEENKFDDNHFGQYPPE